MKYIGLAGNARSGKDKFASLAINFFKEQNLISRRFAFADTLKLDLENFIQDSFGFSCFTTDDQEKALVRPIMIAYGNAKRKLSKGRYWVEALENYICNHEGFVNVALITDVRFDEYKDNDEFDWLKSKDGSLIYIERLSGPNGCGKIGPASEDEAYFNPILKSKADILVEWGLEDDSQQLVNSILKSHPEIWNK